MNKLSPIPLFPIDDPVIITEEGYVGLIFNSDKTISIVHGTSGTSGLMEAGNGLSLIGNKYSIGGTVESNISTDWKNHTKTETNKYLDNNEYSEGTSGRTALFRVGLSTPFLYEYSGTNGDESAISAFPQTFYYHGSEITGETRNISLSRNNFTIDSNSISLDNKVFKLLQDSTQLYFYGSNGSDTYGMRISNNEINLYSGTNSISFTNSTLGISHIKGISATPSISPQSGLGAGAGASLSNASDLSGIISLTSGAITATGDLATITFSTPYIGTAPNIVLYQNSDTTALLSGATSVYVESTTSGFTIKSGVSALTALTTYKWYYHVLQ